MTRPGIVAHRGASGYLPEHTLAAYELGIRLGADAFEIDVVMTRDGQLIARHENEIGHSTDIAARAEFGRRRVSRTVGELHEEGWFTEEMSAAEIAGVRAIEPLPQLRSTAHDGRYAVPALPEILTLRAQLSAELARPVGLKVEVKTPQYFRRHGLAMEGSLVAALGAAGMLAADSPVEVMSFELAHLERLRALGVPNGLVFLVEDDPSRLVLDDPLGRSYADHITPRGLAALAPTVTALGPGRRVLFPGVAGGALGEPSRVFADVLAAGLRLDCWTFRAENAFLPTDFRSGEDPTTLGDMAGLVAAYVQEGVDTVITDHPDRTGLRPAACALPEPSPDRHDQSPGRPPDLS